MIQMTLHPTLHAPASPPGEQRTFFFVQTGNELGLSGQRPEWQCHLWI